MENLKELRRYLHQNPELSGKEKETATFLKKKLKEIGVDEIHDDFSQHSFLAIIKGQNKGENILYRSELDALPIEELNDFSYKSKTKGVSHKCGHDGHMTILVGLAEKFIKNRPNKGDVLLLYQSAEETGEGAQAIIDSGFLKKFKIDVVLALHNVPSYPKGAILCKTGVITPTVESLKLRIEGDTSHAGSPDKGNNPATTIAELVTFFQSFHQPKSGEKDYFVVAPVFINLGREAYGISAGRADIGYTFRSDDISFFKNKKAVIEEKIKQLCKQKKLNFKIDWVEPFQSNFNAKDIVDEIKKATNKLNYKYIEKSTPFDWGEDFGLLTQTYKGAMFGLGSGENLEDLHHGAYDFPDEIIQNGVDVFYQLSNQIQK